MNYVSRINLQKSTIAILGYSFKENIPDVRNTKVIQIIESLKKKNISVKVFDDIVSKSLVKKVYNLKVYDFKHLKNWI